MLTLLELKSSELWQKTAAPLGHHFGVDLFYGPRRFRMTNLIAVHMHILGALGA
jgi:hypothetical protein